MSLPLLIISLLLFNPLYKLTVYVCISTHKFLTYYYTYCVPFLFKHCLFLELAELFPVFHVPRMGHTKLYTIFNVETCSIHTCTGHMTTQLTEHFHCITLHCKVTLKSYSVYDRVWTKIGYN